MPAAPGIIAGEKSKAVEAAAALAVLGYTQQDIAVAMKGVDVENLPLEEDRAPELKETGKIGETINERKYKRGWKKSITFGTCLAMVISYANWHSVGWAIVHGLMSWLYVIYFVLAY